MRGKRIAGFLLVIGILAGLTVQSADNSRAWTRMFAPTNELGYAYGNAALNSIALDTAGNVYVAGSTDTSIDALPVTGGRDFTYAKYGADGTRQMTRIWGTTNNDVARAVALDPAGNVYVAGYTEGASLGYGYGYACSASLAKYSAAGVQQWNVSWGGTQTVAYGLAVDASGNAYVAGFTDSAFDSQPTYGGQDLFVSKFDTTGARTWSRIWGSAQDDYGNAIAVGANSMLYVAGYTCGSFDGQTNCGSKNACISMLFPSDGGRYATVLWGTCVSGGTMAYGISATPDGGVVAVGETFGSFDGQAYKDDGDPFLTRFTSDLGTRVFSRIWGSDWTDYANTVCTDSDGNLYVAGGAWKAFDGQPVAGYIDVFLTKFTAMGTRLWTSIYGTSGIDEGNDLACDAAGNVYLDGTAGGTIASAGDERSVFTQGFLSKYSQETGGKWYAFSLANNEIIFGGKAWGGTDMEPVPGDYDGDGVWDKALYHQASGTWYIQSGADTTILVWGTSWGGGTFQPVSGDFNADGRYEMAVYDAASGSWYIMNSDGLVIAWGVPWGAWGLEPVPGDYDADGATDFALYEQSTGAWYIRSANNNVLAWGYLWGGGAASAVPGDYDGDGGADLALYNETLGTWFIMAGSGTIIAWDLAFGGAGMSAVSGDYNNDGKADLALYHDMSGAWYIKTVSGEFLAWGVMYGASDFAPISGDYNGDGLSDLAIYEE